MRNILSPLTEDATARLVAALLREPVTPAELQQQITERAGLGQRRGLDDMRDALGLAIE